MHNLAIFSGMQAANQQDCCFTVEFFGDKFNGLDEPPSIAHRLDRIHVNQDEIFTTCISELVANSMSAHHLHYIFPVFLSDSKDRCLMGLSSRSQELHCRWPIHALLSQYTQVKKLRPPEQETSGRASAMPPDLFCCLEFEISDILRMSLSVAYAP
jgi:hypothetical protein